MKKIILTTLILVLALIAKAQVITGSKWIIAESGISDNIKYGIDKKIKPLFVFYNKDSTTNAMDYSKIEMHFFNDGKYLAKNALGAVYNGTWQLNAAKDSLTTDSIKYRFDFIDQTHCITNNMNTQVVDSLGTIDTTFSYIILYGTPDITTIKDVNMESGVEIYPNPASDEVTILFTAGNAAENKKIKILNIYGQTIKMIDSNSKSSGNTFVINITDLANGIYFVEFVDKNNKRITIKKLIRN